MTLKPVEKFTCDGCHGLGCHECSTTGHYEYDIYGNYDSAFLDDGSRYVYLDLSNGLVVKEQPQGPIINHLSQQETLDLLAFLKAHLEDTVTANAQAALDAWPE